MAPLSSVVPITCDTTTSNAPFHSKCEVKQHETRAPKLPPRTTKVNFKNIEIREYARIIGDNPDCRSGPPISIGWEFNVLAAMSMDEYEANRIPRRSERQLRLTAITRQNILSHHFGYTLAELEYAEKEAMKTRSRRKKTAHLNPVIEKTQVISQSARRKLRRTFSQTTIGSPVTIIAASRS